jgi:hypothetical protein
MVRAVLEAFPGSTIVRVTKAKHASAETTTED